MANMCRLGIDRTGLYHGLDPLRSLTGNKEFFEFSVGKECGQKGGHNGNCPEGYTRIKDLCSTIGISDQAIRNYANRQKIDIIKGILSNASCAIIIAHYANRNKQ